MIQDNRGPLGPKTEPQLGDEPKFKMEIVEFDTKGNVIGSDDDNLADKSTSATNVDKSASATDKDNTDANLDKSDKDNKDDKSAEDGKSKLSKAENSFNALKRKLMKAEKEKSKFKEEIDFIKQELEKIKANSIVTKDNFDNESEFLDWKFEQRINQEKLNNALMERENILGQYDPAIKSEQEKLDAQWKEMWNLKLKDNFENEERIKIFADKVINNPPRVTSNILDYIDNSLKGPMILEMLVDNPDLADALNFMPSENARDRLRNLEYSLTVEKQKRETNAPGPIGNLGKGPINTNDTGSNLDADYWKNKFKRK